MVLFFQARSDMCLDLILFAYWCSRRTDVLWADYLGALPEIREGSILGDLGDSEFSEEWRERFPWIISKRMLDLPRDLEVLQRWMAQGFEISWPGHLNYPQSLLRIENPPKILFGKGNWNCLSDPCLAVVGSREPSNLSVSWMEEELGKFLEQHRVTVVSGGARGVDQAAHRVALRKGRATVVLFPSGLEQMYPLSWQKAESWSRAVLDRGGLLLSEYSPPVPMHKRHFLERNRLISGLSLGTLLIEARYRSGTLVTARAAIEQGRPVYVIPSHPYDANSRGGLDLILDGANVVRDAEDLSLLLEAEMLGGVYHPPTNWPTGGILH